MEKRTYYLTMITAISFALMALILLIVAIILAPKAIRFQASFDRLLLI